MAKDPKGKGSKKVKGKASTEAPKPLEKTTYPRGKQGTFVYAPDIAVYVQTEEHGIIDLSRYLTNFTLQRNVNSPSAFTCSFDNKFALFDRVVRRMDPIVVFMKRIHWVQVFSGYISVAPWQTVVPGDAQLQADCTLKRVAYTYWDPHDSATFALYPTANVSDTSADGGSAATMFRLLTTIAGWDPAQIQIQRIPEKWLTQAARVMQKAQEDFETAEDYQVVRDALIRLLDADGWQGQQLKGILSNSGVDVGSAGSTDKWTSSLAGGPDGFTAIDEKWHREVGKKGGSIEHYPPGQGTTPEYASGFIPKGMLTNSTVHTQTGKPIYLRVDAAASLSDISKDSAFKKYGAIKAGYLSFEDQKTLIKSWMNSSHNDSVTACSNVPCPAGINDHGWGTSIDTIAPHPPENIMNKYGWIKDETADVRLNPGHWTFVGNADEGYPAYTKPGERPDTTVGHGGSNRGGTTSTGSSGQFDWDQYNRDTGASGGNTAGGSDPAFKTAFFMPQFDATNAMLGKRAWMNNVSLMESIASFAGASMRDFQSAPNGNFIAFFPDRLGFYGKFPTMQVRDIEIIDFKLIITDRGMVTHFASVGDYSQVQSNTGIEIDAFFNSGTLSVEQDEVMSMLLGLEPGEVATGLGAAILDKFGMRPKREDNYNLYNFGYNYMHALHRFMESWANQWQALVSFTFMPEVYPGMRIELADKGLGVYVEQVVHSGSRNGGFSSTVTVSTPMGRTANGKWALLDMEYNIKDFVETDKVTNDPVGVAGNIGGYVQATTNSETAPTEAESADNAFGENVTGNRQDRFN